MQEESKFVMDHKAGSILLLKALAQSQLGFPVLFKCTWNTEMLALGKLFD